MANGRHSVSLMMSPAVRSATSISACVFRLLLPVVLRNLTMRRWRICRQVRTHHSKYQAHVFAAGFGEENDDEHETKSAEPGEDPERPGPAFSLIGKAAKQRTQNRSADRTAPPYSYCVRQVLGLEHLLVSSQNLPSPRLHTSPIVAPPMAKQGEPKNPARNRMASKVWMLLA